MTETSKNALLRMYSDGELDPEQTARVEIELREHAQAACQVEFEHRLRQRVCVVMTTGHPTAPPKLAGRIRDQIRSMDLPGEQAPSGPIRGLFRGPRRANAFAVAASLTLVAGAVLIGIFAPPIDAWRAGGPSNQVSDAATHVAQEHAAAASGFASTHEELAAGFKYRALQAANTTLGQPFGRPLQIADLERLGYEFVGASQCEIPHCESACHYLFRRSNGPGLVSLHVVPDRGQFDMTEGTGIGSLPLGGIILPKGEACPMDVVVFSDGDLAYLLVACVADDLPQVARKLQENLLASAESP